MSPFAHVFLISSLTSCSIITVIQALWFAIKELGRVAKGYPITTLELTTLSFCFITFTISVLWYHKPSITKPVYIETKDGRTIHEILECAKRTVGFHRTQALMMHELTNNRTRRIPAFQTHITAHLWSLSAGGGSASTPTGTTTSSWRTKCASTSSPAR